MPVLAPDAPPPDRAEDDETWAPRQASCSACCGTAASPGSASRRSTAGSASPSSTSTRSPRSRCPTRCRCTSTCRHFSILGADAPRLRHRTSRRRSTSRRMLRGDQLWVQFLSEPTGGSDLAGCLTARRARRRRVGAQRLEDLEHGGDVGRLRACAWPAPTGTCRSTAASPCSSWRSTSRACRSTRSSRSTGRSSSARSSSTTCGSRPTPSSAT